MEVWGQMSHFLFVRGAAVILRNGNFLRKVVCTFGMYPPPPESYFGMFLLTVAKWRPPFEEKRGLALFHEGAQAGANLAQVLAHSIFVGSRRDM